MHVENLFKMFKWNLNALGDLIRNAFVITCYALYINELIEDRFHSATYSIVTNLLVKVETPRIATILSESLKFQ